MSHGWGEYVIDTAEYSTDDINGRSVEYFQLKHSTTQLHNALHSVALKKQSGVCLSF